MIDRESQLALGAHPINSLLHDEFLQRPDHVLNGESGLIFVQFPLVYLAVAEEQVNPLGQADVAGRRLYTDEAARVAEASAPEGLVGGGGVIVICEFRFAGHAVNAYRLAG